MIILIFIIVSIIISQVCHCSHFCRVLWMKFKHGLYHVLHLGCFKLVCGVGNHCYIDTSQCAECHSCRCVQRPAMLMTSRIPIPPLPQKNPPAAPLPPLPIRRARRRPALARTKVGSVFLFKRQKQSNIFCLHVLICGHSKL